MNDSEFKKVIDASPSMSAAARTLGITHSSLTVRAIRLGVYDAQKYKKFPHTQRPPVKFSLGDILSGKHPTYLSSLLRARLLEAEVLPRCCAHCEITEYQGHPIPLELHHRDGDHNNHLLLNLCVLCPNCHALTDTYGSKIRA